MGGTKGDREKAKDRGKEIEKWPKGSKRVETSKEFEGLGRLVKPSQVSYSGKKLVEVMELCLAIQTYVKKR